MKALSIMGISLLVAMVVILFLPLPFLIIQVLVSMLGANLLMCLVFILTIAVTE